MSDRTVDATRAGAGSENQEPEGQFVPNAGPVSLEQAIAAVAGWENTPGCPKWGLHQVAIALRDGLLAERAAHDRRVSELLAANNAEVERRRAEEEEVAYWRTDALARLQMATWLHKGRIAQGEEDKAADLRVSTIMPTLGALIAAKNREFYESCPLCGDDIRPGMRVAQVCIDPDESASTMVCGKHEEPERGYVYQHDDPEAIIAAAKAELADPEEDSEADEQNA